MTAKNFALYGGIIMLAIGVISLIPGLEGVMTGLPALELNTSYGLFAGLFPMNIVNKIVFAFVGLAGILVYRINDLYAWINYSRFVFFYLGLLAILGLSSSTNTIGGYYPLFGNIVALNAVFALAGGYFGFLWYRKGSHHHMHTHA